MKKLLIIIIVALIPIKSYAWDDFEVTQIRWELEKQNRLAGDRIRLEEEIEGSKQKRHEEIMQELRRIKSGTPINEQYYINEDE